MGVVAGALTEVAVGALPPERFASVLLPSDFERFRARVDEARAEMRGRVIWNVNSTAQGGGVAEMLRPLLAYARGAGVDTRWLVMDGEPEFFRITKRLHNHLHGSPGDGGELDAATRDEYAGVCQAAAADLVARLHKLDAVLLHDPQTAGMVPAVRAAGVPVVWRCHVGIDRPDQLALSAMEFLRPFVSQASATVFSREAFIWPRVDRATAHIIEPSIDAFSPKNEDLAPAAVDAILARAGIIPNGAAAAPVFTRVDGSPGRVSVRARLVEERQLEPDDRIVLQVSRWDRLKDHAGVMQAFSQRPPSVTDSHLVLAGPDPGGIADDPEAAAVLDELIRAREALPPAICARVHLALLPMNDVEENAAIVNALQRRAEVVAQKSLAEGFGLTVAEAMWKARPVVASKVGGIQDQVVDGVTGLLVGPRDLDAFSAAVERLLDDRGLASTMGAQAMERVRKQFLGPRHLLEHLDLFEQLRN